MYIHIFISAQGTLLFIIIIKDAILKAIKNRVRKGRYREYQNIY